MYRVLLALTIITATISPVEASTRTDRHFTPDFQIEPNDPYKVYIGYYPVTTDPNPTALWHTVYYPAVSQNACKGIAQNIVDGVHPDSDEILKLIKGRVFVMFCIDSSTNKPALTMMPDVDSGSGILKFDAWVEPIK